jgi:hypothetical protein
MMDHDSPIIDEDGLVLNTSHEANHFLVPIFVPHFGPWNLVTIEKWGQLFLNQTIESMLIG